MSIKAKMVGKRRSVVGDKLDMDYIDVEFRVDPPFKDTKLMPKTHPPEIKYETVPDGERSVVMDQVVVPRGTPDSIVMQMIEEKRKSFSAAHNIPL